MVAYLGHRPCDQVKHNDRAGFKEIALRKVFRFCPEIALKNFCKTDEVFGKEANPGKTFGWNGCYRPVNHPVEFIKA